MITVFGLGNPGKPYANTRHNAGFLAADELARRLGADFRAKAAWQAQAADGEWHGRRVLVIKPQTFMNLSGETVRAVWGKTPAEPAASIIVFDDADLPFGTIRFRASGSAGGQNGMKSILEKLPAGTALARVRIGIGRPPNERVPLEDWVLGTWSKEEKAKLPEIIAQAADEIEKWIKSLG